MFNYKSRHSRSYKCLNLIILRKTNRRKYNFTSLHICMLFNGSFFRCYSRIVRFVYTYPLNYVYVMCSTVLSFRLFIFVVVLFTPLHNRFVTNFTKIIYFSIVQCTLFSRNFPHFVLLSWNFHSFILMIIKNNQQYTLCTLIDT